MSRYLVAGGAGFIGSNLCLRLLRDGHSVVCVDNLCTGNRDNLQTLFQQKNFQFIQHDVASPFTLPGEIHGIFHLASPASPIDFARLGVEILHANAFGTQQLLQQARDKNAWFLLASTSEVYGDPKEHPQREEYWGNVNPFGPRSCYDESKRFAEALTLNFCQRHQLPFAIVRIFNTYGPNMRADDGRAISNFVNQALRREPITIYGEGNQTRCFCFVDDLVEGLVRAAAKLHPAPINLGSDIEISIRQAAEKVVAMAGHGSLTFQPRPQDDPHLRRPDLTRARVLLQWSAKIPLEVGLQRTIEYFRARIPQVK